MPYTLTVTHNTSPGPLSSTDEILSKAVPARGPSQPTDVVVTLHYAALTQPAWSGPWNCVPAPTLVGQATMTCTTPFVSGGQIPPLDLTWSVTQPAVTGTAVLEQGGTPVSNTATF